MRLKCSEPIHAPGILEETLPPEKCLGPVDPATVQRTEEEEKEQKALDPQEIPPIHQVVNIDDFEVSLRLCTTSNLRNSLNGKPPCEHGHTFLPPQTMSSVPLPPRPRCSYPSNFSKIRKHKSIP